MNPTHRGGSRIKTTKIMTREMFNKIASAKFSAMVGFHLDAGMINAKEGIFVSLIAEGNKVKEMAVLPNLDGEIDYDEELNETFAYVKLA